MTILRYLRRVTGCAVALVVFAPLTADASARSPWPLVASSVPATLKECSTNQFTVGGSSYSNLWTLKINAVDLVGERVFTNTKDVMVANPRLTLNAASSFSGVLAKPFVHQRSFIESALAASLKLPTPPSKPRSFVLAAGQRHVGPQSSLVIYATSSIDVSQGFFTHASAGCNALGSLSPWVLSTAAVGKLNYHSIIEPTLSLANGTF